MRRESYRANMDIIAVLRVCVVQLLYYYMKIRLTQCARMIILKIT